MEYSIQHPKYIGTRQLKRWSFNCNETFLLMSAWCSINVATTWSRPHWAARIESKNSEKDILSWIFTKMQGCLESFGNIGCFTVWTRLSRRIDIAITKENSLKCRWDFKRYLLMRKQATLSLFSSIARCKRVCRQPSGPFDHLNIVVCLLKTTITCTLTASYHNRIWPIW